MKNSFEWISKNIDVAKYIHKNTLFDKIHQKEDEIVVQEVTGDFITLIFNSENSNFYMKNIFIFKKEKTVLEYIFERCSQDEYLKAEKFVYERI